MVHEYCNLLGHSHSSWRPEGGGGNFEKVYQHCVSKRRGSGKSISWLNVKKKKLKWGRKEAKKVKLIKKLIYLKNDLVFINAFWSKKIILGFKIHFIELHFIERGSKFFIEMGQKSCGSKHFPGRLTIS